MKPSIILMILIVILVSGIACSNHKDPIQPGQMDIKTSDESILPQTEPISESSFDSIINRNVMGAWKVIVDTNSLSAEIVPARNASAIGDIYDADLSQFLLVSPCHNCLRITGINIDHYDNLLMGVGIKHPFDDITRRPDLHGFDVRAIFIMTQESMGDYPHIQVMNPDGSTEAAEFDNTGWHVGRAPAGLLNADGYTSHFDWIPEDPRYFAEGKSINGNINPFLRFFDDFGTASFDPHNPAGYNVMPVGSGFQERTAVISGYSFWREDLLEIYIVADVAYGHSAVLLNRTDPQYYLPSFNRTEPWRVEYWIENNDLNWIDPLSTAELVVQVFDWQHGHSVDPDYPNSSNLSGLRESSDVLQLELSIPGFQDDPIIVTTPDGGTGSPSNPLQYRMMITNEKESAGGQIGLLAIRDELHGAEAPSGRIPIPESPAGFPYETLDIRDYTLYTPVFINMRSPLHMMIPGSDHIQGELIFNYKDLFASGYSRYIAPRFFMDPSNRKFQYYWDFDYDGITFDADATGLPSPSFEIDPGFRNVGLGVITNTKPPQSYVYTLPLYGRGSAFENQVPTDGSLRDITSETRNHSAFRANNDKYYLVFSHESAGRRNIMLSITDREGNTNVFQVTDTASASYNPSVYVKDQAPGQGVYVAYSQIVGGISFIHVKRGNLDGTGFQSATATRISATASFSESLPVITFFNNALRVYYVNYPGFSYYINASHSNDFGLSWTNDGAVVNNGSGWQINPTICQNDRNIYIAWADGKEYSDRGYDLWLAETSDGISFTDAQNLSSEIGNIHENYPSMDLYRDRLVIAYSVYPSGATAENTIKVKTLKTDRSIIEDTVIAKANPNHWLGMPAVGTASDNRFIVAVSYKDNVNDTMLLRYIHYYRTGMGIFWNSGVFKNINMGSVHASAKDVRPVILSTSPQPHVVENFLAWTDYTTGYTETSDAPTHYHGDLKVSYYVSEKNEDDWF